MPHSRERSRGSDERGSRVRRGRKKRCQFCGAGAELVIDYMNIGTLRQFMDDRSRIRKARQTGACRRHQSGLAGAIKRAREIALVPFTTQGDLPPSGGRSGGRHSY